MATEIIRQPLETKDDVETIGDPYPSMPILYLEFMENPSKVKPELIGKDYVPPVNNKYSDDSDEDSNRDSIQDSDEDSNRDSIQDSDEDEDESDHHPKKEPLKILSYNSNDVAYISLEDEIFKDSDDEDMVKDSDDDSGSYKILKPFRVDRSDISSISSNDEDDKPHIKQGKKSDHGNHREPSKEPSREPSKEPSKEPSREPSKEETKKENITNVLKNKIVKSEDKPKDPRLLIKPKDDIRILRRSKDKPEHKSEVKTKDKYEDKLKDKSEGKLKDKIEVKSKDNPKDKIEDEYEHKSEDKIEDKSEHKSEHKSEDNPKDSRLWRSEDKYKDPRLLRRLDKYGHNHKIKLLRRPDKSEDTFKDKIEDKSDDKFISKKSEKEDREFLKDRKKKYDDQSEIKKDPTGKPTPPTLAELRSRNQTKTLKSSDYKYPQEEDDEIIKKRNDVFFHYEVLKKMHPSANIPEFTVYSDPDDMAQKYEFLAKKLSLDSSVENWKRYMIIFVMGCEVGLGKLNFDMEGFAQQQISSMNTYDQLLIEMAEKSYVPTSNRWPVEARLLMMLTMNIVLFVVSKMIFKKTGTNLLGPINELTGIKPTTEEPKLKDP